LGTTTIAEDIVPQMLPNGNFNQVYGVTQASDGNYYVVVTENIAANGGGDNLGTSRIYRVTPMGVVTLIATDDSNDNVGFYAS